VVGNLVEFLFITAPAFLVVLTLVVFVHEFGHFQVGRWFRIQVKSFSIGMGQPLLQRTDKHGTVWKISSIPLGGFVSWVGDADVSSTKPVDAPETPEELEAQRKQGLYHAQKPGVRALVALAGPMANFVFSTIAFAAVVMIVGKAAGDIDLPARVDRIEPNSAAITAGIKLHDEIIAVEGQPIGTVSQLRDALKDRAGKATAITVRRDGETLSFNAVPTTHKDISPEGVETTRGLLGVGPMPRDGEIPIERPGPVAALSYGLQQTGGIIASTAGYIGNIFSGRASPEHLAGPLGIMNVSGQVAKTAASGTDFFDGLGNLCVALLQLAAFLSVAIGIANLLPIPVLDGGHIVMCLIEMIRGKPLDEKTQAIGFNAGLALIASLFLLATWNDLQRLNVLEFLRGILS
jgi:regulator of sigma E protease